MPNEFTIPVWCSLDGGCRGQPSHGALDGAPNSWGRLHDNRPSSSSSLVGHEPTAYNPAIDSPKQAVCSRPQASPGARMGCSGPRWLAAVAWCCPIS